MAEEQSENTEHPGDEAADQPESQGTSQDETVGEDGQPDEAEAAGEAADEADEALAKLKDQVLRGQAEMENLRRRHQREIENAHKFSVEKLLNDFLPVLDSYEKGIEEAQKLEGEAGAAVAEGFLLAQKLCLDMLGKHGLTTVDPLGEPFDPQEQEAMAMVPNPDMEPNSVMEVLQKGYVLHGRVVRAAKVVVTKAVDG